MSFPSVPNYSKNQIRKAGDILISENQTISDKEWALDVLSRWRACHAYPINTFNATLRGNVKMVDKKGLVAQRLKRMPTIINKLKLNPAMNLANMQDIGGVRAIVNSVGQVRKLQDTYHQKYRFKHELKQEKDYILFPKDDGYRSVHLIFKYKNNSHRARQYNGLLLEIQIRTKLQHIWATAVETIGTLRNQAYKSKQGEKEWRNFFSATSSAFAHIEKLPLVPAYNKMSKEETFSIVKKMESNLGVLNTVSGYSAALNLIDKQEKNWFYHLIVLNTQERKVSVSSYSRDNLKGATDGYAKAEARAAQGEKIESVLVSAGPLKSLRRAYPNYFLDISDFIAVVKNIIAF